MSEELLAELGRAQEWIEPRLYEFVEISTPSPELARRCQYAIAQMGLRERSFLVSAGARIIGQDPERFSAMAIAAECFIAAALTSDDILDGADERWGKPSCLAEWGSRHALLVAEQLHALAHAALDRVLEEGGMGAANLAAAVAEFRAHFTEFFAWQFVDLASEGRTDLSLEEVFDLAYRRTGRLLDACIRAPAIASGADAIGALARYGEGIGKLLQLRDDVLDFVAVRSELGKPILGDLLNGQPNLVLYYAFQSSSIEVSRVLRSRFGSGRSLSSREEAQVLSIVRASGALQSAQDLLFEIAADAEEALMQLPASHERESLRLFLGALVDIPIEQDRDSSEVGEKGTEDA